MRISHDIRAFAQKHGLEADDEVLAAGMREAQERFTQAGLSAPALQYQGVHVSAEPPASSPPPPPPPTSSSGN